MSILNKIVETKKEEVNLLKLKYKMLDFVNKNRLNIDFFNALRKNDGIAVIAEIKKASPSKGVFVENFNHLEIAKLYNSSLASAISILTDEKYFQGNIKFLKDVAKNKIKPLLRKDFIIDEIQIYEAYAAGADAILLICEILDKYQIAEFTALSHKLGMNVLLELHSAKQLDKIDFNLNKIVGVNNRDLNSFVTNIKTSGDIFKLLPSDIVKVAESGIFTRNDVLKLKDYGANAILVGEAIIKSNNMLEKIMELSLND
ncbi:MAG TPA: indole-3-glycerol phosphate synthase TrpC [Ignavibacteriales bacterium]|nr:indole-3-glycerol phosphate synthase TrpC [Ignavibacteriales bacterium]